jgi:hypothetical protein
MEFRRSSHSDERRRRVLLEETGSQLPESATVARAVSGAHNAAAEPAKSYSDAALSSRQPCVIDLIPARRWTLLVLALVNLTVATGLEALYGYLALGRTALSIAQLPAVDLAARGNVGDWFCACLLLGAAGIGILIYLIRRHRADDYRGRYRMWYWAVPLLVVASVDRVADLQTSLRTAVLVMAGIADYAQATLLWSAAVAVIGAAVTVRLAVEMRACRLAVGGLLAALVCLMARQPAALAWLLPAPCVFRTMCVAGLAFLSSIQLLLALSLYARHVHRDARGEIAPQAPVAKPRVRTRRPKREAAPAPRTPAEPAATAVPTAPAPTLAARVAEVARDAKVRVDQPHTAAAPVSAVKPAPSRAATETPHAPQKQPAPLAAVTKHVTVEAEADDDADDTTLSKAERRRQRKLERREKRRA